ncbi:hypothetical protein MCUN1_000014 [Malassezia cuniculi]|uniref:Phospholipid/glycerol acyltransferase domain-containing protein n=1 Tax=Malassezia cuniculi TaxID=948313 RepID=A0AAF0EMU6_9BASI|nr:hypothetical protein MCUN1_000014 [Malassezia cuniculi]
MYGASPWTVAWRLPFVIIWEIYHLFCLGVFLVVTRPLAYAKAVPIPTPFGTFKFHPIEVGKCFNLLMHAHLFMLLAPSKCKVSFGDGKGNFIDPSPFVRKDKNGNVTYFNLPRRGIWMVNHQLYTDWLYLWGLAYSTGLGGRFFCVLKASLGKVPVLGPAMAPARFILMSRNWERDEKPMTKTLQCIAKESGDEFVLQIFPEGTDLARKSLAKSQEFARKNGFPIFERTLAPRSTGIQHCIEILGKEIPDMHLLDFTLAYSDGSGLASERYPGGKDSLISVTNNYWKDPYDCAYTL